MLELSTLLRWSGFSTDNVIFRAKIRAESHLSDLELPECHISGLEFKPRRPLVIHVPLTDAGGDHVQHKRLQ